MPDTSDSLSLRPIALNPAQGRWRTEAMRSHSTGRLIFFHKGQGRITVAGLTSGYGPNNLVYIPANTMFGYEINPMVHGQILTIPAAMQSEWPDEVVHLRLRDVVAQKEAMTYFDHLETELKLADQGARRAAHYHLGILAIFFERQMMAVMGEGGDPRGETSAARLVAAYSDLVERNFRDGLHISDYARLLGVTPTHLTRCCRATCGQSALGLLNDRKLYEARLQLRTGKTPVQDIARQLGFSSPAYFARSFHARTGQTPTAFRKKGQTPAI